MEAQQTERPLNTPGRLSQALHCKLASRASHLTLPSSSTIWVGEPELPWEPPLEDDGTPALEWMLGEEDFQQSL